VKMPSDYGNQHRMFLQAMVSRGVATSPEARRLYKLCCQKYGVEVDNVDGLASFINAINRRIKDIRLELRKTLCEETDTHNLVLISSQDGPIPRLSTDYTPVELEYFKKLVELILESEVGKVSSIRALNLVDDVQGKMSKKDAERLIARMVDAKWLLKKEGVVSMTARCVLELEPYLRAVYSDVIRECNICRQIELQGLGCEHCQMRIHKACAKKRFSQVNDPKCPVCDHELDLFEAGVTEGGPEER